MRFEKIQNEQGVSSRVFLEDNQEVLTVRAAYTERNNCLRGACNSSSIGIFAKVVEKWPESTKSIQFPLNELDEFVDVLDEFHRNTDDEVIKAALNTQIPSYANAHPRIREDLGEVALTMWELAQKEAEEIEELRRVAFEKEFSPRLDPDQTPQGD